MTAKKETGGPAFPHKVSVLSRDGLAMGGEIADGMTLRDYFAAAALSALIAVHDRQDQEFGPGFNIAERAFGLADSMLKARK